MNNTNIYELLYLYHSGSLIARECIKNEMNEYLKIWVYKRTGFNSHTQSYKEDLYQEALLALYEAMDSYRDDKKASFVTYTKYLVDCKLTNFITRTIHNRSVPSEFVMSLDKLIADECEMIETVATSDSLSMPEYRLAFIECKEQVDKALCSLDVKEKDVLYAWHEGMSYEEGCARLHMSRKTYDGKLQKVKKTIRRACAINKTAELKS